MWHRENIFSGFSINSELNPSENSENYVYTIISLLKHYILGSDSDEDDKASSSLSSNKVEVEFDDGDSGKITIDQLRLLPQDFPIVGEFT